MVVRRSAGGVACADGRSGCVKGFEKMHMVEDEIFDAAFGGDGGVDVLVE